MNRAHVASTASYTLRFDGAVHIHTPQVGAGWKRVDPSAAEKKCPRCHGAGITTRAGGVGCFVCGKAGRPE